MTTTERIERIEDAIARRCAELKREDDPVRVCEIFAELECFKVDLADELADSTMMQRCRDRADAAQELAVMLRGAAAPGVVLPPLDERPGLGRSESMCDAVARPGWRERSAKAAENRAKKALRSA